MIELGRRDLLALPLGALAAPTLAQAAADELPSWPPAEHIALWPGRPPGAPEELPALNAQVTGKPGEYRDLAMRGVARPDIGVFRPAKPDGRGVLVIPGGGYEFISLRNEGMDVARVLNAAGITAFVLRYRLPNEGWRDRANTPLADAQRAMRVVRHGARRFGIDPDRLGVIGFSAGGHLAGSLATQHAAKVYKPIDADDRQSARPAFAGLIYAVSNVDPGRSHAGSRAMLLGPSPDPEMQARYAVERNIGAGTPPLFLLHTTDDTVVPVQNSIDSFAAARAAKVPVSAHFMPHGGHGFGVRLPASEPASLWPELFIRWTAKPA
ncbi:alpha/beta hydrolase [Sphingomonas gilva]|uniref:Alpha/beta hydrolase n=1 Tax=Sphingomonas gilva TaxID=2305907 RepID=A0A396RLS2_9SPHN|nr:alpha/beta hydrolase [Sphingomonas gilva]RHW16556.1 alpha/beta hydrolase [Sphingomonas gilva]